MPKRKLSPEQLAAITDLAKQWGKIVAKNAYGVNGPGPDVDFDEMEQIAAAATAGLAAGTLEHLAEQQAQHLPDELPCPTCQRSCPLRRRPRTVVARGATVTLHEPVAHCPACRRDFSPQRANLRLDSHGYSPSVLAKVIHAGAAVPSFELAAETLRLLADVPISGRHVGRLTELVGAEMVTRRDEQAERHRTRQLGACVPNTPAVVAVEVDGGRYQRRAEGHGCGAHQPQWREDKVACLVTLASDTHEADPQPEPPDCFLDRRHVRRMTQCPRGDESDSAGEDAPAAPRPVPREIDWQPERLVRTCVATTRDSEEFGRLVGAEAKARHFEAASRCAFVADGQAYNWAIQKRWFADYTPVADFIHVLGYVWQAASAATGGGEAARWDRYVRWMRGCWQGRVSEVSAELDAEQQRLGEAPADAEATDPRVVLSRARGYLGNNAQRMKYPEYRRAGLPVTSSWVESLIKEVNYRVKGTEKFWNEAGAESVLAVRAAVLSDDDRLAKHLAARPGCPFHRRTKAA